MASPNLEKCEYFEYIEVISTLTNETLLFPPAHTEEHSSGYWKRPTHRSHEQPCWKTLLPWCTVP